jgi:hypothetical protein
MAAFQFYLQSGKQRKVEWAEDHSHVVFGQQFPVEKKKDEMVRCHDATASCFVAKVLGEVFAHFYAVAVKGHSSMRNSLFGLAGRIPYEQSSCCQRT